MSIYLLYVIGGVLARQAHRLVIDNWFAHPLVLCYGLHTQLEKIGKAKQKKEEYFNAGGTVAVEWSKEKKVESGSNRKKGRVAAPIEREGKMAD